MYFIRLFKHQIMFFIEFLIIFHSYYIFFNQYLYQKRNCYFESSFHFFILTFINISVTRSLRYLLVASSKITTLFQRQLLQSLVSNPTQTLALATSLVHRRAVAPNEATHPLFSERIQRSPRI